MPTTSLDIPGPLLRQEYRLAGALGREVRVRCNVSTLLYVVEGMADKNWEALAVQLHHRIQDLAAPIFCLTAAGTVAGSFAGSPGLGAVAGLTGALSGVVIAHHEKESRAEILLAPYNHVRPQTARTTASR